MLLRSGPPCSLTAQTGLGSQHAQPIAAKATRVPCSSLPALTRVGGRVHAGSGPAGSWRWGLGREGMELR